METLTRPALERIVQRTCGADPAATHGLELAPHCHPDGHVDAAYWDGVLRLRCAICHAAVAHIAVASVSDDTGFDHTAVTRALRRRTTPPTHD